MKANYVSHLSDPARFVQVVPIQHGPTLQKIHQTYRLFYLKDVMLARIIDDPTYTMLNSFIFFHQIDIVQHLQQDQQFLDSLFHLFEQPADEEHPESVEKQREAILLLHQFCMLAKNLQLTARHTFYRTMADRGLLRALEVVLQRTAHLNSPSQSNKARTEAENAVRVTAIEILMMLIDHHPNSVRSYCLKSTSETSEEEENPEHVGRSLVSFLISLLSAEEDLGIQAQIAEAIKVLAHAGGLSPAAAASNAADHGLAENARLRNEDPEAEKFLQYFYDHCIGALFKPILDLPDPSEQPSRQQAFLLFLFVQCLRELGRWCSTSSCWSVRALRPIVRPTSTFCWCPHIQIKIFCAFNAHLHASCPTFQDDAETLSPR